MFGISGYTEAAPRRRSLDFHGKYVHEGYYLIGSDMDYMDPGEIDQMKYEHGLIRHFKHQLRTAQAVADGEQLGQIGAIDFRDLLREGDEVHLSLDELFDSVEAFCDSIRIPDECDCDHSKGESCYVCCVKVSPETVCVLSRTEDGKSLYNAEISDEVARKLGFMNKRQLTSLRRRYKESKGSSAPFALFESVVA